MRNTYLITGLVAATFGLGLGSALAQSQQTPPEVTFNVKGSQMSLRNSSMNDKFDITLEDGQIVTTFEIECSAGQSKAFLGVEYARSDERCAITGQGLVKNPSNPSQKLLRTGYSGDFTIDAAKDGFTPAEGIKVSYQAMGNVPASADTFEGSMIMMPENPGENVTQLMSRLQNSLEKNLTGTGTVSVVDEVDAISFNNLRTPSAGFPSDKGCMWDGTMIYAYANDSWVFDLSAMCNGMSYDFEGNMPWVDIDDDTAEYQLNLAKPSTNAVDDGALFTAGGGSDLFAAVDGIAGTITIDMSDVVAVTVGDTTEDVPTKMTASAKFVGTNVPVEVVRSLAQVFAINARALFGA